MEQITLVIPPGLLQMTPNHEGSSGLGAVEPGTNAFRYAPHTLATMAAALLQANYDVTAIDAPALGYDIASTVKAIREARPRVVGVFVSWCTRESDALLLEALHVAMPTGAPVIACGISVCWMHDYLAAADYLLEGEPEIAFRVLCDGLVRQNKIWPRIIPIGSLGLPEYDDQGLIQDLDALPYPAWHLFPRDRYTHLSVLSSRGCSEHCLWCPYVVAQGSRWRGCTPGRVIAELESLVTRYRPRRVIFRDPVFATDRERVEQICLRIIGNRVLRPGKRLIWECESRPEHLDRRLLRLMSLAGCVGIKIGLETTDAELLHTLRRIACADSAQQNHTARYLARVGSLARDCARLGIAYRVFVLAGLPGQSLESARETAGFVQALQPYSMTAKTFKPYPGLDLSSAAPLPLPEETAAQERVLLEAEQAIEQNHRHIQPRWRLLVERLISHLATRLPRRSP